MITEILKNAILANLGPLKQAPKGWMKRCCMLCHTRGHGKDTRNRFGIQFNADSIAANCFNCGFSSSYTEGEDMSKGFETFLKEIHIDEKFIRQIRFEIFKIKNSIKQVRDGEDASGQADKITALLQKWKTVKLPDDSLSIKQWLEYGLDDPMFLNVVQYAINRRIYNLDEFFWTPDTKFQLNQRLLIPYYFRGRIVGYTSRLYYDPPKSGPPKYFQQCPTDFVYNLDHQENPSRKYVIVNEGVLDAWTVDGVSILGEIGQEKIDIINRLQKQVIVCPDRDQKGRDLVDVAIDNNWAVSFPKWDSDIKDAAKAAEKYGRLLTTHSIIASAVHGKDKIRLTWDIRDNERRKRK